MRKVIVAVTFWRTAWQRLYCLLPKHDQTKCLCFKQRNGDNLLLLLLLYLIKYIVEEIREKRNEAGGLIYSDI